MKVASTVAPIASSTIIKMEDRKRPASQSVEDLAPSTKRQAVNGASKASADSDMPWKDDLEVSVTRPIYTSMLHHVSTFSPSFGSQNMILYRQRFLVLHVVAIAHDGLLSLPHATSPNFNIKAWEARQKLLSNCHAIVRNRDLCF